jgi:2Fe-2S ferredoxin
MMPLPEMNDDEAMLSEAFYVKSNTFGLSNPITESLEGLELELAPEN